MGLHKGYILYVRKNFVFTHLQKLIQENCMHINDTSFELMMYKLKSARQKKRLQKKDFDKNLIRLYKLRDTLSQAQCALPMVPLQHPYQHGFKRSYILSKATKQHKQAGFFQTLLDKINTSQYSNDKVFKTKRPHRKQKYIPGLTEQHLIEFKEWDFKYGHTKLTEREKEFFYRKQYWCTALKAWKVNYVFSEPWRFVLQIKPYIVSEVKMIDELLEQHIEELDNYIKTHHLDSKMSHLKCGKSYRWVNVEYQDLKKQSLLNSQPLCKKIDRYREEAI